MSKARERVFKGGPVMASDETKQEKLEEREGERKRERERGKEKKAREKEKGSNPVKHDRGKDCTSLLVAIVPIGLYDRLVNPKTPPTVSCFG